MSIGKLYGDFEAATRDWQDGILAKTVREAAADKAGDTHWITLDGPVDTIWIENLNTVLDDNKKLCLISGEIVKLTQQMTMMFEVEDLMEASPATVSRCGMVYVTPEKLGWEPLLHRWVSKLPEVMKRHGIHKLYTDMIEHTVPAIMDFLFGREQSLEEDLRLESLKPILSVSKNWVFRSFLNLFESLLLYNESMEQLIDRDDEERAREEARQQNLAKRTNRSDEDDEHQDKPAMVASKSAAVQKYYEGGLVEPAEINKIIQQYVMAMIWGFGAQLTAPARRLYSDFLIDLIDKSFKDEKATHFEFKARIDTSNFPTPPKGRNLFNIFYKVEDRSWLLWDYDIHKYDILGDKMPDKPVTRAPKNESDDEGALSPRSGEDLPLDDEFINKIEFQNIMVATEDSIQNQYMMEMIVGHAFPILIVGGTGTGKTRIAKKLMTGLVSKNKDLGKYGWESGEMVLSATSTPSQVQSICESKLEKHQRGVLGPKNPSNHLLIFVDDLNMPTREIFGARPALEMLR